MQGKVAFLSAPGVTLHRSQKLLSFIWQDYIWPLPFEGIRSWLSATPRVARWPRTGLLPRVPPGSCCSRHAEDTNECHRIHDGAYCSHALQPQTPIWARKHLVSDLLLRGGIAPAVSTNSSHMARCHSLEWL